MRDALQQVHDVVRWHAAQLERGVRSDVQHRSAVVLGRYYNQPAVAHGPILLKHGGVLVHKVARALAVATRHHLPRALTASLGAKLVQGLRKGRRLLKLRDPLAAHAIANGAFSAATSRLLMPNLLARAAIVAGSMVAEQLIRHHVAPRVAKLQLGRAVAPTVARLAGHIRSGASARKPDASAGGLLSAWEVALHVMAFVLLAHAAWLTFVACTALKPRASSVVASREASSVASRALTTPSQETAAIQHTTTLGSSRTKKSSAMVDACSAPVLSSTSPDSVIGNLDAQGEGLHVVVDVLTDEAWEEFQPSLTDEAWEEFQRGRTRRVQELRRMAEAEAEAKAEAEAEAASLPSAPVPPPRTRRLRFNPKVDVAELEAESVLVPKSSGDSSVTNHNVTNHSGDSSADVATHDCQGGVASSQLAGTHCAVSAPAPSIVCSPVQAARGTVDEPKVDADADAAGVGNDTDSALERLAAATPVHVVKKTAADAALLWLAGHMIGRGDRFNGDEVDQRRIQFGIRRNLQRVRASAAAPFRAPPACAPPPPPPAHFPAAAALFAPT